MTEEEIKKQEAEKEKKIDIRSELDPHIELDIHQSESTKRKTQDKNITVTDAEGNKKRVSNIFLGRNKENFQLKDGTFVRVEDIVEA